MAYSLNGYSYPRSFGLEDAILFVGHSGHSCSSLLSCDKDVKIGHNDVVSTRLASKG